MLPGIVPVNNNLVRALSRNYFTIINNPGINGTVCIADPVEDIFTACYAKLI
jgi:hypothetical protein